jgi:hypothetical protein
MRRLIFALALVVTLSACVTGERMRSIREGMSKDEVIATLGNPDGFQRSGDDEALRYTNRLISGWSWDRADYNVILRNGRVVEYGAGQVRQRDPNTHMLILVPIR